MKLPFEPRYRAQYYQLLDQVFESNFWSEGQMVRRFENMFAEFTGLESLAVTNGGTGLLSLFEYCNVRDKEVIVPANTFWATSVAAKKAGARVVYADCSREDLCLTLDAVKACRTKDTRAVVVVHIGGHIAFEIEEIAAYCNREGLYLIEDCAHAHGARFNGKSAGAWGIGGAYSFYATKTMPTGEGGMVCSRDAAFIDWLRYSRNYGKEVVDGVVSYRFANGFNYRMNEVTAALGIVQLERLPEILAWKARLAAKYDRIFERQVVLPPGMVSGYYKYIVFGYPDLAEQTGQVFGLGDQGPVIDGADMTGHPESEWVTRNHQCPPIYYGWDKADLDVSALSEYLLG